MALLKRIEARIANPELNANFNREVSKRKENRNHGEETKRTTNRCNNDISNA